MPKIQAKTISDFRAAHDPDVIVPNKIREALAAMAKVGPEHYEYEGDFVKLAGLSQTQISAYREQFIDHIVKAASTSKRAARNVWFADIKAAKKVRG